MRPCAVAVMFLLASCVLLSCRTSGPGGGVPDEEAQRARIDTLFTAEQSGSWRGFPYD